MQSKGFFGRKRLDLQLRERDLPPPDGDQVLVKVRACGVCGTDINFVRDWEGEHKALGHEISAEVIEVGKNVTTVKPGDCVIVEDCTMCGLCADCRSGQPQFCRCMHDIEGQPGMGEYLCVRYNCLDKYEGLDHVSACLTEPLAVSLTSVLNAQIPLGGSVAVFGPGPLGLMSARVAKLSGAGYVAMIGLPADNPRERARQQLAARFGCDDFFESGRQDLEAQIKRKYPAGVDRAIVSSPPESMLDALRIIKYGGDHHLLRFALRRQKYDSRRHQRPDLPQDLADPDVCRAGDQFSARQPPAARRTRRCQPAGQPHVRVSGSGSDTPGPRRRNRADHQGGHVAARTIALHQAGHSPSGR